MKNKIIFLIAAIILVMLVASIYATYFISWQNWNDDFEDGVINNTLWNNISIRTGTSNNINCFSQITETIAPDGYIDMLASVASSGGQDCYGTNYFKTKQDYNDGKNYNITFRMDGSTMAALSWQQIVISNQSNQTDVGLDFGPVLFQFDDTNNNDDNYTITIIGNNFTLYNSTAILNSTLADNSKQWRIEFLNYARCLGACSAAQNMNLYNYTSIAGAYIVNSLVYPTNNLITSNYTPYFSGIFNASTGYNLTNATLYVWNSSGSQKYNTTFNIPANTQNYIINQSLQLNYTNYTWNYFVSAFNGVSTITQWASSNNSFQVNDSTAPVITINQPVDPTPTLAFNINISVAEYGNLSYCYFNITRGASTEVANTAINLVNFTENTSVSGLATYNLNVWCNDSNQNVGTKTFSFNVGSTPITTPSSGGGGGGGGTITNIINALSNQTTSSVCIALYPPFSNAWQNFLKEKSFANFKVLWFSYWNYTLCKNSADLIPI